MKPFPSPADWQARWIYALLVDRFNNPRVPPRAPWDAEYNAFQGGTFDGIRARLDYFAQLGVGAILLSPVLKNCQYDDGAYHGYGPQDFQALEPRFASAPDQARRDVALAERELVELVDQAHARDICVLLDVVLHHVGDVFAYERYGSVAPLAAEPRPVRWRDEHGEARPDWREPPRDAHRDAGVWPPDLRQNDFFGRRGNHFTGPDGPGWAPGDFIQQKAWATEHRAAGRYPVRDFLTATYQCLLEKYDLDGFRVDTFKYLEPEFGREFTRSIRAFARSIGKANFLIVGEIWDGDETIASYLRPPGQAVRDESSDILDGAFDYPLFSTLVPVVQGRRPPSDLVALYAQRDGLYEGKPTAAHDPRDFFVTFLDNHDQCARFLRRPPDAPDRYRDQLVLALGCLFCLPGIPCLYYGTEQGLHGGGGRVEAVREALWGKPGAFDPESVYARAVRAFGALRRAQPALRRGRLEFRPTSTGGACFDFAAEAGGVLAFARVLDETEVLVVANCSESNPWSGEVLTRPVVDPCAGAFALSFSNTSEPAPAWVAEDGGRQALSLRLDPMELQILVRGGAHDGG